MRVPALLCLVVLAAPALSEALNPPPPLVIASACLDPRPSDEALVRRAAKWMLPDRTIEIPEFETGTPDAFPGTTVRFRQAGRTGVSLMPVSSSVSHPETDEFSISAVMNLAATLGIEYSGSGVGETCELTVQGLLAVSANVMVDRSQPTEDRIRPLSINQVNDSGLQLQGCSEVAGIPGFVSDVKDQLAGLAVTAIFVPACRPCENSAFQACTAP